MTIDFSTVIGDPRAIRRADGQVIAPAELEIEVYPRWSSGGLVFLHEGLGSVAAWRTFPTMLSTRTNLPAFVYSRAGYGNSPPVALPRPLTYMHDEAALLPDVLAYDGFADPILVGHSDGASIAIIAAATTTKARALVLIAPHVFVEDVSIASIAAARDTFTSDLRPRLRKYHRDVDNAFWGWNGAWLDPAFRAWNLERYLPALTIPTLIVQGDADPYGTLAQVDAIASQHGGRYTVEIVPGAGHAPHRDPAVVERIAAWLATTVTGPSSSRHHPAP